ncbi:AIG2-like protein [Nymphaea thermarum]|nr:AIG2-like protein [Nymphaea thermarum]
MAVSSSPSSALRNVFVYGTLLADEVVHVLLKRVPDSAPAILPNYHRYSIKNRVYPAILPVDKIEVIGKVLFEITDPELRILDEFEDFEYERNVVEVSLVESSEIVQAYAYVWRNKSDPDLYGDWDLKEWKEKHIDNYLVMTCSFASELEEPEC